MIQFRREWTIPSAVGIVSFGAGGLTGYFLAKRMFEKKQPKDELRLDVNPNQLRLDLERVEQEVGHKLPSNSFKSREALVIDSVRDTPIEEMEEELEELEEEIEEVEEELEVIATTHNVFVREPDNDDWDYEVEVPLRNDVDPCIIHRDEFEEQESGYPQTTLTYYKGDDILTDENDVPIYNYRRITGELRFGHGSKDPSIVYIRNPTTKAEYEVLLDEGTFQFEVLGQTADPEIDEIKHSVRKFRAD